MPKWELRCLTMKVLLRNRRTRLYYTGRDESGVKPEDALDFGNISRATEFTFEQRLADMEIVLRYATCPGEVPLPILPAWRSFQTAPAAPA
jgi:hypothetical protein